MANTLESGGNPHISERRIHQRQRIYFSCLELGENNRGVVLNVSQSGLALRAVAELTDDELPKMRFQFSQSRTWIEVKGRIAWRSDSNKVAGVEFLNLSDKARKQIRTWIFLIGDALGFPKTNARFEKTEQVSGALSTLEPTTAIRRPEPKSVELVPKDPSQQSVFPLLRFPGESLDAGTVSGSAVAARVTRGSGKAGRLLGLSLAAVLLLLAFVPLRHYSLKAGNSQKVRETAAALNVPGPSSKISTTATANPGPAVDHPVTTANPGPSLDHPSFVLQVGAMASEGNAIALADLLCQMNFPAFVFKGPTDRFHYVFVGPFTSVDASLIVKKDLERRGFKAFRTEWKPQATTSAPTSFVLVP